MVVLAIFRSQKPWRIPWFFPDVQPLTPEYGCIYWIGVEPG